MNLPIKKCYTKLIILNILLLSRYCYIAYGIECEPCLDNTDCPPCMTKEQYFIIYFGIALNIFIGIYCIIKPRRS